MLRAGGDRLKLTEESDRIVIRLPVAMPDKIATVIAWDILP